eukprot:ctg_826.g175
MWAAFGAQRIVVSYSRPHVPGVGTAERGPRQSMRAPPPKPCPERHRGADIRLSPLDAWRPENAPPCVHDRQPVCRHRRRRRVAQRVSRPEIRSETAPSAANGKSAGNSLTRIASSMRVDRARWREIAPYRNGPLVVCLCVNPSDTDSQQHDGMVTTPSSNAGRRAGRSPRSRRSVTALAGGTGSEPGSSSSVGGNDENVAHGTNQSAVGAGSDAWMASDGGGVGELERLELASADDSEESGEDLLEDMERDYQPNPELDRYETDSEAELDPDADERMDAAARR